MESHTKHSLSKAKLYPALSIKITKIDVTGMEFQSVENEREHQRANEKMANKPISIIEYTIKVIIGIYIHMARKFTVNHLYGSNENTHQHQELLVLPSLSSTIFSLAVLLQIGRFDWFHSNYLPWAMPKHLRSCCNILLISVISANCLNGIWIAVISCVRLIILMMAESVNYGMGFFVNDHHQWANRYDALVVMSLLIAAASLIYSLHMTRKMITLVSCEYTPTSAVGERYPVENLPIDDVIAVQAKINPPKRKVKRKK